MAALENLYQILAGTYSPLRLYKTSLKTPIVNKQELWPWHRLLVLSGPTHPLLSPRSQRMSSLQVRLRVAGNLPKFTWRPGAHWHGCHPHPIKFRIFPSTMTPQTQTRKHARWSRAPPLIKQAGLLPAREVDSSAKLSVPTVWRSSGVQMRPQSQALPMSRRGWLLRKLKLRNFRVRWSRGPDSALWSKLLSVSWLYSGSQV